MTERRVIGHEACIVCEAMGRGKVINEVRLNKNGCGYWYCTHCAAHLRYNKADTAARFLTHDHKPDYSEPQHHEQTPQTIATDEAIQPGSEPEKPAESGESNSAEYIPTAFDL